MLKLRLKRCGRKKQPSYRLVVMLSHSRRDGRPIDEVGYYNTIKLFWTTIKKNPLRLLTYFYFLIKNNFAYMYFS